MGRPSNAQCEAKKRKEEIEEMLNKIGVTKYQSEINHNVYCSLDLGYVSRMMRFIRYASSLSSKKFGGLFIRKFANYYDLNYDYKTQSAFFFLRDDNKTNRIVGKVSISFNSGVR